MTKYLFSILVTLLIAHTAYPQATVINIGGSIPVTEFEIYQGTYSEWEQTGIAVSGSSQAHTSVQLLPGTEIHAADGPLYIRINRDDSLVYQYELPSGYDSTQHYYDVLFKFEMTHAGLLVQMQLLYFGTEGFQIQSDPVPVLAANNPLDYQNGEIQRPQALHPMVIVRAAIYEIWNREIHRMWVIAAAMFMLGIIWFVRKKAEGVFG